MRPLVLTSDVRAAVAKLVKHAKANPVSVADLRKTEAGTIPPVGDNPDHRMEIPLGYLVVYSHELQPRYGLCRHLSVSIPAKNKGPGLEAVNEIAKMFGFKEGINSADHVWREDLADDHMAVNMIQRVLEGDET